MAHRGNRVTHPENTLAAFRQAVAEGADIVETDLHLSADGVFVCIHDATVDRTTDGSGAVAEMTLAELKTLSAAYGRPEFADERIPTLPELVAALPDDVAIALELKSDRFCEPQVCQQLVAELDRTCVRDRAVALSFSLPRIQAVQAVAPDIPIGWITLSKRWPLRDVQLLGPAWPLLLQNPLYILTAHARGQLVCPLDPTPDSRLWFYRLLSCDVVLTDDPGATSRALGRYGPPG
jgi:glycerophosphoryl diester phosphodiesterase